MVLVGVIGCAVVWREPLWAHGQIMWWQRACANYEMRSDGPLITTSGPSTGIALPLPGSWISYESSASNAPPAGPARQFQTLAFLHRLRSPGGHERIVAARCIIMYLTSASVLQAFQCEVVEPAEFWSLSSRPKIHLGRSSGGYPTHRKIEVFGGRTDPADPAHFTIAYTVEGKPGTIDGWLNDDETVKLQIRAGSADVMTVRKKEPVDN